MNAPLLASLLLGVGLVVPQVSHAQSINIPLPAFSGGGDRGGYCADLRRRSDEARYDVDNAQFRGDRLRAEDRLRAINDQMWRDCR